MKLIFLILPIKKQKYQHKQMIHSILDGGTVISGPVHIRLDILLECYTLHSWDDSRKSIWRAILSSEWASLEQKICAACEVKIFSFLDAGLAHLIVSI